MGENRRRRWWYDAHRRICIIRRAVTQLPGKIVAHTPEAGSLWGMGNNFSGELGDGTTNNAYAPVRIVPPPPTPVLTHFSINGINATLTASNGLLGATYYVVTSTNMA